MKYLKTYENYKSMVDKIENLKKEKYRVSKDYSNTKKEIYNQIVELISTKGGDRIDIKWNHVYTNPSSDFGEKWGRENIFCDNRRKFIFTRI